MFLSLLWLKIFNTVINYSYYYIKTKQKEGNWKKIYKISYIKYIYQIILQYEYSITVHKIINQLLQIRYNINDEF